MGNSANSRALLEVPIERAVAPFRLSKHDVVVDALTRLRLEPPGFSCNYYQAFDADDKTAKQPRFNIQRMMLTYRVQLLTNDNRVILSVEEKAFEGVFRVFEGIERDHESFRVRMRGTSSDAQIWIEFKDRISGDAVRVSTEGHCGDTVALFYMERHAAELPPMPKRGKNANATPRGKVIGRVRRAEIGDDEFLVATKGVDLTLLLLLWIVRHDIEERRGTVGSVPKLTKFINAGVVLGGGGEDC